MVAASTSSLEKKQGQSSGHGGRRQGAGRKPGSATLRTRQIANELATSGELLPLDYMLSVLRDKKRTDEERMDAAKSAAPYVHPRLAAVDAKVDVGMDEETRAWLGL